MSQITKDNFKFLEGLRKNNTKPYFEKNKDTYLKHHEEMISFAEALLQEVKKFDLKLNEFGSASGEIILPNNGLTGEYTIEIDEGDFSARFSSDLRKNLAEEDSLSVVSK